MVPWFEPAPERALLPLSFLKSMPTVKMTELLLSALDTIAQGVILTDSQTPDNPIVYANVGFERLTGYRRDEIIGRNCRFLQGAETDPAEVAAMRAAIADQAGYSGTIRNYRKDGTPFWNELTIAPVGSGSETGRFFVGFQADVTERLQLEERLRESQKMEALGKLAGGVAHDFNNLLALTLINAELILDECGDRPQAKEAAGDIISAVEAGSGLVRGMLDFARDRTRAATPIDVNRLVADTVGLLRRTVREPVRIDVELCDDELVVDADRAMFETALINLALNARDAMPTGGRLLFRTRLRSDAFGVGSPGLVLTVSDTGCGMDETAVRRAFEPYYTTKGPERGTGLGLSMVYSFAVQSGGEAAIRSGVDEGTAVELLLPLKAGPTRGQDGRDGGRRILIVEDEAKLRRTMTSLLRREGYVVDHAANVAEALELVQAPSAYDLILSDIRLPGDKNGIDLVRELIGRGDKSGFVLMTGFTDQLEAETRDLGGIAVLRKPFRAQALLDAVRAAAADAAGRTTPGN